MAVRAAVDVAKFFREPSYVAVLDALVLACQCPGAVLLSLVPRITPPYVHTKVRKIHPIDNAGTVHINEVEEDAHPLDKLAGLSLAPSFHAVIAVAEAERAVKFRDERF